MFESEVRPVGYPKTDGWPKEVDEWLWGKREWFLKGMQRYPLGKEISVRYMLRSIKDGWNVKKSDPQVRKFLKALSDLGYPIGSNEKGFYWAFYRGELTPTIEHLVARRTKIDERIQVASHINRSLPERK